MKSDVMFMLNLVGSIISGAAMPEMPEHTDWNEIYRISERHSIANIIGYGVSSGKYNIAQEIKAKFLRKMFEAVAVNENQQRAFAEIFKAFDEANIDYMPLKGLRLKNIYASADMRNMSDGDILIKTEQFESFDRIMKSMGYSFEKESNHEYVYKKPPFINVELHKILVPSYNNDLYAYYGDGWKLAKRNEGSCRYELNTEDNFIYIFTHFAKHYRDGGAGIKYVADIWLYLKKFEVNTDYVFAEFEKLGLKTFAENTFKLAKVWFEGENSGELSDAMTEYIINGGEYGSEKNAALANEIRENQDKGIEDIKKSKFFRLFFPSLIHMQKGYPALKKYPFLLPVFWIVRIIRSMIFGANSAKTYKKKSEYLTDENLSSFDRHMRNVGLDIYNGRKKGE